MVSLDDMMKDLELHVLNGFFFNTKKTVSTSSRYLVR